MRWHVSRLPGPLVDRLLKPLNTCKKRFETILLYLPPDECKIQGEFTIKYSKGQSDGCLQSESGHKQISFNKNDT